jgi:signal peptidase
MSRDQGRSTASRQRRESGEEERASVLVYVRDVVSSASAVLLVGLLLFSVSGVWPPLVAIESPSMEPHIDTGDLVFVMEEDRFPGPNARHGVTTAAQSDSYVRFEQSGDVIVFAPDGNRETTPIIHRAMLWVDEGENWYDRADPDAVGGAKSCADLRNCPAPYAGFITKGDNNVRYDQVGSTVISNPVRPAWVVGTAELRVPLLGQIRLRWNQAAGSQFTSPETVTNESVGSGSTAAEAGA